MTVLVVDDDAACRDYTCDLLKESGFSVTSAADGASALSIMEDSLPACLVLDIVMPGLSGFDVLRALRQRCPSPPPVVVLTSMNGGGTRTYATKVNGAAAFVTKAELDDPATGIVAQVRRLTHS
jgi:two-component system response regulator PrrA